jgi:acetyltransferase-like isoleucine patch superfamily enzyme
VTSLDAISGADCRLDVGQAQIGDGARIGDRVTIKADRLILGDGALISDDCVISAVGGAAGEFELGDHSLIGPSSSVLTPRFVAGDYVAIHNHLLANGYEPCWVGHNTWIGQNCVLNSTAELTIGNNVGIGAYSSIYTHAWNGELLEGCEIHTSSPVRIEDNAWLVGAYNVVSPGVTIGARAMVLTSSVVSKDVPPAHTVAGVPARDMTDRITAFRDVTLDQKVAMMRRFVDEFVAERHPDDSRAIDGGWLIETESGPRFFVVVTDEDIDADRDGCGVVYARDANGLRVGDGVTVFDISTKQYVKRGTAPEIELIRFMNGYRARFVPADRPRIGPLPPGTNPSG